jgi:hypothetical protein
MARRNQAGQPMQTREQSSFVDLPRKADRTVKKIIGGQKSASVNVDGITALTLKLMMPSEKTGSTRWDAFRLV